jgi:hypothetical protein
MNWTEPKKENMENVLQNHIEEIAFKIAKHQDKAFLNASLNRYE